MGTLDQEWSGVRRLSEPVVIPDGAVLTIRPGTKVVVAPGVPAIVVLGMLRAEGAEGRSGSILFFPEGEWGGLLFKGSSKGILRHVRLEGGEADLIACVDSSDLKLTDTRFLLGATGLRCGGSSRALLTDSWISEQAAVGVLAEDRSEVKLERVSLTSNSSGVTSTGGSRLFLDGCRIQGNSQCGVNAMGRSELVARDSQFEGNHTAVSLCDDAQGDVRENAFHRNLIGVHAKGRSKVNLWRNRFHSGPALDVDLVEEAMVSALPPERIS